MKRLHKDQRGFTILELLLVIILTGIITTAITTTIFQVFNMNTRTANHMIAVSQVQQAGKLVSEDILQAQNVTAGGSLGFPLTLTWAVNATHEIIYTLENMPSGEFKRLQREHKINSVLESTTIVAEYIDPDQTSFYPLGMLPPGGVLTFTVTVTVGDESETRVYEVKPRSL